ncbi:DUF1642 domain-containing protein [Streptococcus parasanguinis]|uniref:DUF1642 domain-containing protein n=1 Tax=Streptococcus parasanguinis TaxID=1318 RepID=UPI0020C8F368|nr:DUF1642 domain-containing protein [Streptococcus parasanguinis]MCP8990050.1 DUF1642 domain-containing protein [Streptococcus parasanguinis]MCP8991746.1 DUF1642 domain-containing protein [Streptococcus parasanguinis]MCP9002835.1 DUF1642 domain-containing protein [Streptococcus parasanguinis]MCP9009099.1 DUF1642 domain-containing protein [Streptococcus parasanguinis]MCP9034781.1 DUF1642 domain-containing protein [Streptococcus parasanguinis]
MEPWYKFILYGTYDGFSRSTLGDDNLYLVLENGEKVEVPRCFVKNASDFIEKDKLKLKDVIARIKKLDLSAQEVWLNEILNELGSDYGTFKYKDGYEQGKLEGLIERENVMITQDVADYIEYAKEYDWDLQDAMDSDFIASEENRNLSDWFYKDKNMETFALAWINGYDVEKEKRYTVKMKAVDQYLVSVKDEKFLGFLQSRLRSKFTRKELAEAGFGWVFDCPGIEIEEVE